MAKNSTLFSNASFISHREKDLKEKNNPDNYRDEMCPGDALINNILSFSKALKIEKSREIGTIRMMLN